MTRAAVGAGFIAVALLATGCTAASVRPDNAAALADIAAHRSGDEVIVEGIVSRVDHTSSGPTGVHERFDIRVSSGAAEHDVLVADNISVGEPAPVRHGDDVIVKGVLEIDPSGPVIHWTHHDPSFRHAAGFVIVHGKMYD